MPPGHRRRRNPHRLRRRGDAQADAPRARAGVAVLNASEEIWYAGYGSNLDPARFRCYLLGGCPPGATRTYPGARDRVEARDERAHRMPGRLVFAWRSPTWGGGIAFHEPAASRGRVVLARAYLVTARQLCDVLEQEMRREPGVDHDLGPALAGGRHVLGPGRYETLVPVGRLDGRPVVTLGCDDARVLGLRAPAAAYVATLARGLRATHGLTDAEIVDYLLGCPGVTPTWTRSTLLAAVA